MQPRLVKPIVFPQPLQCWNYRQALPFLGALYFQDRASLCSPGCPVALAVLELTCSVGHAGLCLLGAGIKDEYYHTQPVTIYRVLLYSQAGLELAEYSKMDSNSCPILVLLVLGY